jgi:hypothetical protein
MHSYYVFETLRTLHSYFVLLAQNWGWSQLLVAQMIKASRRKEAHIASGQLFMSD